jgi:hypothetical protein
VNCYIYFSLDVRYTKASLTTFAELYIAGNLVAIIATMLFVGARRLCNKMAEKTRRVGTTLWFTLMIGVFVAALLRAPLYVILLLIFFETLAGIWYAASYIPFGRRMIVSICQGTLFLPCPQICTPLANQV